MRQYLVGLRGAISVKADSRQEILRAAKRLLKELIKLNAIRQDEVISLFFSTTPNLTSQAPARAAREMGWHRVPMLCLQEMPNVGDRKARYIRVLLHLAKSDKMTPRHVYLGEAKRLRPDLA